MKSLLLARFHSVFGSWAGAVGRGTGLLDIQAQELKVQLSHSPWLSHSHQGYRLASTKPNICFLMEM